MTGIERVLHDERELQMWRYRPAQTGIERGVRGYGRIRPRRHMASCDVELVSGCDIDQKAHRPPGIQIVAKRCDAAAGIETSRLEMQVLTQQHAPGGDPPRWQQAPAGPSFDPMRFAFGPVAPRWTTRRRLVAAQPIVMVIERGERV